jgi:NADH-quinone oxidoreductase subunit J
MMTSQQIIFILVGVMTLGAAFMVVTTRHLVHAALWLIVTLFGVAIYYGLLNAGFLAVAQVVIYIGAIAILFIFVVMITRPLVMESGAQVNRLWWLAAVLVVALFSGLAFMLNAWPGFTTSWKALSTSSDPLIMLGEALVAPDGFLLPFELASVLLLAALVGAIIIAWERR